LHLVGDEHDPVLLAALLECGQVVLRRHYEPAFTLHRLHDERRHVFGGDDLDESLI
jgi:hypothetical protein